MGFFIIPANSISYLFPWWQDICLKTHTSSTYTHSSSWASMCVCVCLKSSQWSWPNLKWASKYNQRRKTSCLYMPIHFWYNKTPFSSVAGPYEVLSYSACAEGLCSTLGQRSPRGVWEERVLAPVCHRALLVRMVVEDVLLAVELR